MKIHTVKVKLPHSLYERLHEVAEASGMPLEEVALQSIRGGMPPSLQKVPAEFHAELLDLNKLNDQELWDIIQGKSHKDEKKNAAAERADVPTLRRAYAFALLKWRGHPMPDPSAFML